MARLDTGTVEVVTAGEAVKVLRVEFEGDGSGTVGGTYTADEFGLNEIHSAIIQMPYYQSADITYASDKRSIVVDTHTTSTATSACTPAATVYMQMTIIGK